MREEVSLQLAGPARGRIAALNINDGLATPWNPDANSSVNSLAITDSIVYVGGFFTNIGGTVRNRIGSIEYQRWSSNRLGPKRQWISK